jgi:2-polyprenyl-3-methyl-5-hydroxy-6-metoxy-1,4-benzoquinol methylase
VDPVAGVPLVLEGATLVTGHVKSARLVTMTRDTSYEVRDFIPRFSDSRNYARSFGLQWQIHAKAQLDSCTGATYSRDRFFHTTGWPEKMAGDRILEVGSGAGRFTEVILKTGARVYSFDLSDAVLANYANNAQHPDLCLFQGDLHQIPFPKHSFDRVICLGVLQHTPDVAKAFQSVAAMVRPNGRLAIDCYPRVWKSMVHWKYLLRPLTKRMRPERLHAFVAWYVPKLIPVARALHRIAGAAGRRLVPILDQTDKAVSQATQAEWAVLDTYDALSARYDQPQTDATLQRWFAECGLTGIEVRSGIGRGIFVGQ